MENERVLTGRHFMQGNVACAEGALAAGCSFMAGYPITPASEVSERMASRLPALTDDNGVFIQMEDEISSLAAVVSGNVDGIVLTGGLARDQRVVKEISDRISFLAPVLLFPGENELESLAVSVIEALSGKQDIREYS